MRPARLLASLLPLVPLAAQGTRADYERAARLAREWPAAQRPFRPEVQWLDGGRELWFRAGREAGAVYVRVDATGAARSAATLRELGIAESPVPLQPQRRHGPSADSSHPTKITFENRFERPVRLFWSDGQGRLRGYGELAPGAIREQPTFRGHVWVADFAADDLAGVFTAAATPGLAVVDAAAREVAMAGRGPRPDAMSRLFVREHDVYGRGEDGEEFRLTHDGSAASAHRRPASWSPTGSHALGFRVTRSEPRTVHLIEAAPADQLQPRLHSLAYRKPGDAIDERLPVLFDLAGRRAVPIDPAPFAGAWSVEVMRWSADGREVFLLHNERGHQRLAVLAVEAATGAVRTVFEERSATFVDYSQKLCVHWLDDGRTLLWASERDGWNHLYRVDMASGAAVQVTRGEWVFRRLEHVDEAAGEVWFAAHGIVPDQDPYHLHLARIGLDGKGLVVLTKGDGDHEWSFAPDRRSFVDRWSRVDLPPVTEWRDARDGTLRAELGRDDATALLAAGFRPPERFVAKGRDGVTDIHGILILPSDFDPARRYPVLEAVYAGPQDFHVPKQWGLGLRQRALAELGFVVVQIDGMGTNWRHKAFQDVCWRNLADGGFPDRIVWLAEAAASRPWLDLSRVGVYGGSAGGQNALAALLHHGHFYRAGAADCGCHDNRMDKVWWNEAWMGYPVGPWYADNSNVTHAAKLQGKLLLTVGELDRNVDPASTMQVVKALIAADKDFDLLVVPGGGHGVGETSYAARRRADFFVRHLLGVEPRAR